MSCLTDIRPYKGESLLEFPADYTMIDIETTGFSPDHCEILEVSALRVRSNQIVDEFSTFVKPHEKIPSSIVSLTGITDEMLENAPHPQEIFPEIIAFLGEDILVGHNVNFDINFLYDYSERYSGHLLRNCFVDTMRLSRKLLPDLDHHRLEDIANAFSISYEGAHRALADCKITKQCYDGLRKLQTTISGEIWENDSYLSEDSYGADYEAAIRNLYSELRPVIDRTLDAFNFSERHIVATSIQDGLSLRYSIGNSGLGASPSLDSKAGTTVILRIRQRRDQAFIEIPANRLSYYAKCGPPTVSSRAPKQSRSDPGSPLWYRFDITPSFDIALWADAITSDIRDYLLTYPYEFGCCSLYQKCSNAKKCVQSDQDMSASCYYKKNLMRGIIFYSKNTDKRKKHMIPPKEGWHKFSDGNDREEHYRKWRLSPSATMIFYNGHYSDGIVSCKVLGYQENSMAVIQIGEELHCINGEYLSEMQPKRKKAEGIPSEYVVVDTETTSKYLTFAEIVEIAAIKYRNGEKVDTFSTLVKPKRKIPAGATDVNGITDADVADAPSWETVKDDFFTFIGNLPIVGHNITYDIKVIQHESNTWMDNPCIDTVQRAKKAFPCRNSYRLEALKQDLSLSDQVSHRALADCETTNALLWACENT